MTVSVTLHFASIAEAIETLGPLAGAAPTVVAEVPAAGAGKPNGATTARSSRTAAAAPSAPAPSAAAPAPSTKPPAAAPAPTPAAAPAPSAPATGSYAEIKAAVAKLGPALVAALGQADGRAKLLGVAQQHGGETFLALEKATDKHEAILADLKALADEAGVEL